MTEPRDPIREARSQWLRHGWDEAADGMAMVTSVVRVQQLLMERINAALRPHDLSFARYEILRLLAFSRAGAMPMKRLGSLLQVHPTSVTSAVDRLEGQGFVRRERGQDDGRIVLASLTDEGSAVVERATTSLNTEVFEKPGLTPADTVRLTAMLESFRESSGDLD